MKSNAMNFFAEDNWKVLAVLIFGMQLISSPVIVLVAIGLGLLGA